MTLKYVCLYPNNEVEFSERELVFQFDNFRVKGNFNINDTALGIIEKLVAMARRIDQEKSRAKDMEYYLLSTLTKKELIVLKDEGNEEMRQNAIGELERRHLDRGETGL